MALITRVSRLFRADLHAVLDRIEEPAVLLRQAVREMEEELARDEHRVKALTVEQGQLAARQGELDRTLDDIDEELAVCFASDKEDLARPLIKRKLEAQAFRKLLVRKRDTLDETLAGLRARLQEDRVRLDSMRQKAELLAEEEGVSTEERWPVPDFSVRDEDVEVALLREKQRRRRS